MITLPLTKRTKKKKKTMSTWFDECEHSLE